MSTNTLTPRADVAYMYDMSTRAIDSVKAKIDKGLIRYDAWFLVFVAVILALGATLIIGMSIWCVVKQGKKFTGNWQFKDWGLKVYFECS